jgi:hypothetical protein
MDHGTIYVMDRGTIMCDRSWYDHVMDRGTIYVIDHCTIYISPSNYYSIVNVPPKLPIVLMYPLKLPKNVNVLSNDKNTLHKIIKIKKYIK